MNKIKVIIADDHKLVRKGFIALLNMFTDIEVIDEAENGKDLLEKLKKNKPDVILLDLRMPEMDGFQAMAIIKAKYPQIKIIIISMHDHETFLLSAMNLGANGYILKSSDPSVVNESIKKVAEQDYYFTDEINVQIYTKLLRKCGQPNLEKVEKFSEQELTILKLFGTGLTTKDIAEQINLSIRTVEMYRERIMKKAGVKNTAEIILFAVRNNFA